MTCQAIGIQQAANTRPLLRIHDIVKKNESTGHIEIWTGIRLILHAIASKGHLLHCKARTRSHPCICSLTHVARAQDSHATSQTTQQIRKGGSMYYIMYTVIYTTLDFAECQDQARTRPLEWRWKSQSSPGPAQKTAKVSKFAEAHQFCA